MKIFPNTQNGKVERHIKSINNIIRTLLAHASLPLSFWHHALEMATYLLNILPTTVLGFMSPTQILYQCDPIYSELHVFGCLCFPLFPSTSIHKLQERSTPCVYLGPALNHRGSKCYDMSSKKIIICRHVKFVETEFPFSMLHSPHKDDYTFLDFNPISHHLHHQSNTPPDLAHQADHTFRPRPVASTDPPQPAHSSTSGTVTLHALDQQPGSPPSFRMRTGSFHQQAHHPSPDRPTTIPTPLPSPTPHPMTTQAKNGIYKPNSKYFSNFHAMTTTTISPLPKDPASAIHDPN